VVGVLLIDLSNTDLSDTDLSNTLISILDEVVDREHQLRRWNAGLQA